MATKMKKSKFTVIWQEVYMRSVKSGAFIFGMVFPVVLMGIFGVVGFYLGMERAESVKNPIAIVTTQESLVPFVKQGNPELTVVDVVDEPDAAKKLAEDTIVGYFVVTKQQDNYHVTFNRKSTSKDIDVNSAVGSVLTAFRTQEVSQTMGLSPEQVVKMQQVSQPLDIQTNVLDEEKLEQGQIAIQDVGSQTQGLRTGVAYVGIFLLYIFLLTFSSMIGQEVASEKGTRMMEVVLSSTTAMTHLLGKLVGVTLVVLTQVGFYVFVGVMSFIAAKNFFPQFSMITELLPLVSDLLLAMVVVMLISTILFITLSALVGSMVSKIEDVQKAISPIIMIVVLGLYVGMFAMSLPNHIIVRITTFIPVIAPFVIPFRLATDTIAPVELWSAVGVMIVFTIIVVKFSVVFYQTNVLIYSDKGILQAMKQSFALMRSERKNKKR